MELFLNLLLCDNCVIIIVAEEPDDTESDDEDEEEDEVKSKIVSHQFIHTCALYKLFGRRKWHHQYYQTNIHCRYI